MALPDPQAGLVIRYSYLWHRQAQEGREEGEKDRPCAIVVAAKREADGQTRVMVAPISHTPPEDKSRAVEIPPQVGRGLGLDWARSWINTGEVNTFTWPGPDIRAARGERFDYGRLPFELAERTRREVFDQTRSRVKVVERDEIKPHPTRSKDYDRGRS